VTLPSTLPPAPPLTLTKTMKLLNEVVKEKGRDFVYKSPSNANICKYAHNNRPGCLVGQVLHRAGVPISALKVMDDWGSIGRCVSEGKIVLDPDVKQVLQDAQTVQDRERTWGEALDAAKHRAAIIRKAKRA